MATDKQIEVLTEKIRLVARKAWEESHGEKFGREVTPHEQRTLMAITRFLSESGVLEKIGYAKYVGYRKDDCKGHNAAVDKLIGGE